MLRWWSWSASQAAVRVSGSAAVVGMSTLLPHAAHRRHAGPGCEPGRAVPSPPGDRSPRDQVWVPPGRRGGPAPAAGRNAGEGGPAWRWLVEKLILSDEEWRSRLTAEQYAVLRGHGTEPPGSGRYLGTKEPRPYVCAGCGNPLFRSGEKFESGTGWPSFTQPVGPGALGAPG